MQRVTRSKICCCGNQKQRHFRAFTITKLVKHYAMKAYRGGDVQIHIFLTSALLEGECSGSRPSRFTTGERAPVTHWIGGWVDPRADVDDVEKRKFLTLPGIELRTLGRPAHSQSLYRLRYPGSVILYKMHNRFHFELMNWCAQDVARAGITRSYKHQ
jgi:hypothetical protein